MTGQRSRARGIALISVLFATVLLLALVTVLVDVGTLRLQRATADVFGVEALGGADAGVAWARAVIDQEQGDETAILTKLGATQNKRRFTLDDQTYIVTTVALAWAQQGDPYDHVDDNVQQNLRATEQIVQVSSSAAVYVDGVVVARRDTSTLLRVFPAAPYSEVAGSIDAASAVGIESPGDAAGQFGALDTTELLVHAYTMIGKLGTPQVDDNFKPTNWSDGNSSGPGPLP